MTYTWNGPAGKDAMKKRRQRKRDEAEARQANVLPENTRQYRLAQQGAAESA